MWEFIFGRFYFFLSSLLAVVLLSAARHFVVFVCMLVLLSYVVSINTNVQILYTTVTHELLAVFLFVDFFLFAVVVVVVVRFHLFDSCLTLCQFDIHQIKCARSLNVSIVCLFIMCCVHCTRRLPFSL